MTVVHQPWKGAAEAKKPHASLDTPKILLYSHDTFGLGNIRRTLLLSQALREEFPHAAILIVTGSPVIHAFHIPEGIDYIKLLCLDRIEADHYEPRFLNGWTNEVREMREAILSKAILGFCPDLMIVDKRPSGVDGELLEALQTLRRQNPQTRLVVGIRDILDEPERTQQSLQQSHSFDLINELYDEVWIYGTEAIFDTVKEYAFPESVAQKTRFCGYLRRPSAVIPRNDGPPRVFVTTGGGGDGGDIIEAYLEGLLDLPRRVPLHTVIMFGPQMPDARRALILERFGHLPDVDFRHFEPDLTRRYAEADVVVSMAGYNTVCELLSIGRRAILVPREEPVQEQLIRARLLAAQGYFDLLEKKQLTPHRLMAKVLAAIEQGPSTTPPFDLGGLPRIRERARVLLNGKAG